MQGILFPACLAQTTVGAAEGTATTLTCFSVFLVVQPAEIRKSWFRGFFSVYLLSTGLVYLEQQQRESRLPSTTTESESKNFLESTGVNCHA